MHQINEDDVRSYRNHRSHEHEIADPPVQATIGDNLKTCGIAIIVQQDLFLRRSSFDRAAPGPILLSKSRWP